MITLLPLMIFGFRAHDQTMKWLFSPYMTWAVIVSINFSANMRRGANVGLLLGQRRRRWAGSKPTLAQRLMFAGLLLSFSRFLLDSHHSVS